MDLSNSLEGYAKRYLKERAAGEAAVKRGIYHFMNAGDILIEAKKKVPHGDWITWLAVHCEEEERTAQDNMKLARHRVLIEADIEANPQRVADLSKRKALKLIASATAKSTAVVPFIPPDQTNAPDRLAERDAIIARGMAKQASGIADMADVDFDDPELIAEGRERLGWPGPRERAEDAPDGPPDAPRGLLGRLKAAWPLKASAEASTSAQPAPLSPAAAEAKAFREFLQWTLDVCGDAGETPEETAESLDEVAGWLRLCSDPRKWADDLAVLGNEAAEVAKRKSGTGQ